MIATYMRYDPEARRSPAVQGLGAASRTPAALSLLIAVFAALALGVWRANDIGRSALTAQPGEPER